MKRTFFYSVIMLLLNMAAMGQKEHLVPFEIIQDIADRNAQALWGDVFPAEPIPYYGFDDEIVAWRFNYSIGKPFPSKEELRNQTKGFESDRDSYNQWGGDDFGRILIGARDNRPVLLEYSRCLSAEYALGNKLDQLTNEAFGGKAATSGKIFYLNHFNTWHQLVSENESKYVCTSPTGGIIDEEAFAAKKTESEQFSKPGDFKELWNSYQNGYVALTDGDKYINYHECMPYYDWSYGCSPTAAAMIFAWYDYRSLFVSSKYSGFVSWHFQRYDDVETETDYNVCNLQYDLALAMSTDTTTGSTQSYNIDNGMNHVANSQRAYNFDCVNRYTLLWTRLTEDIDAGKPLLVSIPGHSTAGVGYNGSTDMAITHYTHDPPDHLVWVSRWDIDMITRVSAGGQKGSAIQLTSPFGDPRYNNNGNGEVYSAGNYAEITWLSDPVPGSWVDLLYSTDGGHHFNIIVTGTENDGAYNWLIPAGISSTSCRVVAYLRTPDMEPRIAGSDGSRGNFIINNAGAVQTMVSEHLYSSDSLSRYYHFQHTEPSWAAIGAKSDFNYCNWEIQLYNNTNFNQNPAFSSTYEGITNFMVVDGNHYPSSLRGIKIKPLDEHRPVQLEYEGGNENLVFGENGPYTWNANEIVEMKDIHLAPGKYYFELETTSGWPDLGMALYGSTDGIYLKPQTFNIAYSNYTSGAGLESFTVNITQEDDYGLCVFSNRHEAGIYKIKILNAWIWTGAVSSNWHEPGNWNTNLVPDNFSKVVITGDGHDPIISESFAMCADLNILNDGRLRLNGGDLMVTGNLRIHGWLLILNPDNRVSCDGDIVAEQYSYIEMTAGSGINAFGDWTFGENSNILLNSGFVDFRGSFNSTIYCLSETSRFYDLKISKISGATVRYDNHIGIQPLRVKNEFLINYGGTFIQSAMHTVILEGTFTTTIGGNYYFQDGTVRFERAGAGGFSMSSNAGSYFNDVVVSVGDWLGLSSDIEIRGDLLIEEGTFKTNGYDISIKGNWTNNATFNHGNARVTFNGTGIQEVRGTNFWELNLNKSLGELRVPATTVSVQHYDWTQGTVRVNGGWFQLNDLEDPGIYGTVILTSGQLDLHQDPGEYLDLNGNLQISGGSMNIYGGNGDSYWPFSANASFTMSDGILDFKSNGLRIHNSATYSLTENITGGVIRLNGSLTVARTDFNPAGGTMSFYGYAEDETVSVAVGSNLFNLELDKSSKGSKALVKTLSAIGTLDLNGDFLISGGNFEAPTKMYVGGSFINTQSPYHFDELTGEVVLDGSVDQVFNQEETFYKLTINKPGDGTVTVANDVIFTVLNALLIDRGNMVFDPGSSLMLNGNFDINYLGNIYFYGEAGNEITVTSASKSQYGFDVSSGGFISANNTVFSNMDADGIYLHSGCYVDSENAFLECNFNSGAPGGTLITWDNGAEVVVHNAVFPANSSGCTYNVKKTTNSGHVFFDLATGPFSGAAFESDPFSRVDWEYVAPLSLPFTENWNSNSFTTQKWVPEGANWLISGAWGNPAPSADFHFYPTITNYSVPLRSHLLDGTEASDITLKYDIRFASYSTVTLEQFKVQVVQQNGDFITLATYNNSGGSFGFITAQFDISDFADGEIFYLRFTAFGANSWNIDGWFIDNIMVSGIGPEPGKVAGFVTDLATGLPVENAIVSLDGYPYSDMTDATGEYSIINVNPGTYSITASATGYETLHATGIVVVSGESTFQNFAISQIPPVYCTEMLYVYGCDYGDGFDTFRLAEINNSPSGCSAGGYGDFTAMTATISRGYPYALSLSSNYSLQHVSVWVDFNDDSEFDVSEKIIADFILQTAGKLYTIAFTIPEIAPTGTHRLRARSNWNETSGEACAKYGYGETEDYTVNIVDSPVFGNLLAIVTDDVAKGAIENARIEIAGTDWFGFTEEEGICIINDVKPGLYDIVVTAENYEDLFVPGQYIYAITVTTLNFILNPVPPQNHSILLNTGWQGLSSYLMPAYDNIENIFAPIYDELVIASNFNGFYWPDMSVNTLGSWKEHDAFFVKVNADTELQISGYNETNKTINLNEGWTLMPVVSNVPVVVADLMASVAGDIFIVKEIAGTGVYWPGLAINNLIQLNPGKAYLALANADCSVTFPENPETKTASYLPVVIPPVMGWDSPVATVSSHIISIPFNVFDDFGFEKGDVLGCFTNNGICAGKALIEENTVLTIFADDPISTGIEGFIEGETMNFRIATASGIKEIGFEFDPLFPDYSGTFTENGISVAKAAFYTSISQNEGVFTKLVIYPNPGPGLFNISNINEYYEVKIVNSQGNEVFNTTVSSDQKQLDLRAFADGLYFVSFTSNTKVFIEKLVICR